MEYVIYKLKFKTDVHFGNGMLNDSIYTFQADTLFSALYIEAVKIGLEDTLYRAVSSGQLLFSDALPYIGEHYMIPKPRLYIEMGDKGDSSDKKKFKRLKYLPITQLEAFLSGDMDLDGVSEMKLGYFSQRTMAAVRTGGDTLPYQVGTYHFFEGNGLYLFVGYACEEYLRLAEELLTRVSYEGIGGKRASGLGRFELVKGKKEERSIRRLQREGECYMLLSCALPLKEEMEQALDQASYLLEKRSGFITSDTYADRSRKKKDLHVFSAGSCFHYRFLGGVYDVSEGGGHPVYRYAIPMFMEV